MIYRVLADLVLVIHSCVVLFVVLGSLLLLRWPSVIRLHLPAVVWGIVVQFFFYPCPLTLLENWFRQLGGQAVYTGGFVSHYISTVLYAHVSRPFQAFLGLLLIALNVFAYSFVLIRRHQRTGLTWSKPPAD